MVHHRQDATGRFQNHHSVFVPVKRRDENKLKEDKLLSFGNEVFFRNRSLLLFLLDVFVLGIFRLIFECRAVIYQLLDDFL